ncbi:hypothetical protein C8R43DRAFT_900676, partial [Mycena crocata]
MPSDTETETSRGRPIAAFIANHFTRLERKPGKTNRYFWKCNYCGDEQDSLGAHIEGRDNNLPNHISDTRKCSHSPSSARAEALRVVASKKPLAETVQSVSAAPVIDVDSITSPGIPATVATVVRKKRKLQTGTLDGCIDQAMNETQRSNADRKFLRYLIHANVSFRSAENEYLTDFLHDLRPSYDAPKRYVL